VEEETSMTEFTPSMVKTLKEHEDVINEIDVLINRLQTLVDKDYWGYIREYEMGLLDASLGLLKKVKESL